jgi:hypothetical protein
MRPSARAITRPIEGGRNVFCSKNGMRLSVHRIRRYVKPTSCGEKDTRSTNFCRCEYVSRRNDCCRAQARRGGPLHPQIVTLRSARRGRGASEPPPVSRQLTKRNPPQTVLDGLFFDQPRRASQRLALEVVRPSRCGCSVYLPLSKIGQKTGPKMFQSK